MGKRMYKNLKLQQKFQILLTEKGWQRVQSKSGKYIVYFKEDAISYQKFIFLGAGGGVRTNTVNAATSSMSQTDKFKKYLYIWEENKDLNFKIDITTI